MSGNLTSKILSVDSEETSHEELRLFSDQCDLMVQILRSNKIPEESISQLQEQYETNLVTYTQKLVSQPETLYLIQQCDFLKVYLRCLILTNSQDKASQVSKVLFQIQKSKKEVSVLEKLVDFTNQEVEYLFMQKKWFMLQQ